MTNRDRYLGALLGMATGDAIGTTIEFEAPGTFVPVTDMVGGGPFSLKAGEWTDDTSMGLCLAESLLQGSFDPIDQLKRYVSWYRTGHMSSNGKCFDIGNTVRAALHKFEQTGAPYCGATEPNTAGNGSLMRLAPVPLHYANDPTAAINYAADSSRTTHGALVAVDACRYFAALIVGAIGGASKQELLADHYSPVAGIWQAKPLCPEIAAIASGSYKGQKPPFIKGTGYAAKSLEAALWAFENSQTFDEGCLLAVNLGDDADTTAAIYGQLAGAFYGVNAINPQWLAKVAKRDLIESLADKLYAAAQASAATVSAPSPAATTETAPAALTALAGKTTQAGVSPDPAAVAPAATSKSIDPAEAFRASVSAIEAITVTPDAFVAAIKLGLPQRVAEAKRSGLRYILVCGIHRSDYTRPTGAAGIHPGDCRPEWLHGEVKEIYDYCVSVGLKTHVAFSFDHREIVVLID